MFSVKYMLAEDTEREKANMGKERSYDRCLNTTFLQRVWSIRNR